MLMKNSRARSSPCHGWQARPLHLPRHGAVEQDAARPSRQVSTAASILPVAPPTSTIVVKTEKSYVAATAGATRELEGRQGDDLRAAHKTASSDGAMGEGIAIGAAGNPYTAKAAVRGVTKYVSNKS